MTERGEGGVGSKSESERVLRGSTSSISGWALKHWERCWRGVVWAHSDRKEFDFGLAPLSFF